MVEEDTLGVELHILYWIHVGISTKGIFPSVFSSDVRIACPATMISLQVSTHHFWRFRLSDQTVKPVFYAFVHKFIGIWRFFSTDMHDKMNEAHLNNTSWIPKKEKWILTSSNVTRVSNWRHPSFSNQTNCATKRLATPPFPQESIGCNDIRFISGHAKLIWIDEGKTLNCYVFVDLVFIAHLVILQHVLSVLLVLNFRASCCLSCGFAFCLRKTNSVPLARLTRRPLCRARRWRRSMRDGSFCVTPMAIRLN